MTFPPGINVEGATLQGEVNRELSGETASLPRWSTSAKNQGLPPPSSPSSGAPARRGHAGRRPATYVQANAGNRFQPASNKAFQATPRPQRQGLRPLREMRVAVENMKRVGEHRQVVTVSPIRRHLLDPPRRKWSIQPAPAEAPFPCPLGRINPPWRQDSHGVRRRSHHFRFGFFSVARLHSTLCLPFLRRISCPSSNMWFRPPAMVWNRALMFSHSSREVIGCRRTPLLDRLRGLFHCDIH